MPSQRGMPPPPTRFGPAAVQAKPEAPVPRMAPPPPPTRFGPAAAQAKPGAPASRMAPPPPPTRFGPMTAQPKPGAPAPPRFAPTAASLRAGVVQRMNTIGDDMIEAEGDTTPASPWVLVLEGGGVSGAKLKNWKSATKQFADTTIAQSGFNPTALRQVALYTGNDVKGCLAETRIYIAKDGYVGRESEDLGKWVNLYETAAVEQLGAGAVACRVVILVAPGSLTSKTQLYTSLLHEWHIHAMRWTGVIDVMGGVGNEGKKKMAAYTIQSQTIDVRAYYEHQSYFAMSEEKMRELASGLGESEPMTTRIAKAFDDDRKTHSEFGQPLTVEDIFALREQKTKVFLDSRKK